MKIKAFHVSHYKNRESIKRNGLNALSKNYGLIQYGPRVFFSIDKEDLAFDFVNYENVDCWEFEVDLFEIKKDPFSGSKNHFYIESGVSPDSVILKEYY